MYLLSFICLCLQIQSQISPRHKACESLPRPPHFGSYQWLKMRHEVSSSMLTLTSDSQRATRADDYHLLVLTCSHFVVAARAQYPAARTSSSTLQELGICMCPGVLPTATTSPSGNGWPWLQEMSLDLKDHVASGSVMNSIGCKLFRCEGAPLLPSAMSCCQDFAVITMRQWLSPSGATWLLTSLGWSNPS